MFETLKKVLLLYEPFKGDEILHITLKVVRNVPYISSEWPSRIILWLSRRYHVISVYSGIQGNNSFFVNAFIVCDKDFFRQWSYNPLIAYVRRVVK